MWIKTQAGTLVNTDRVSKIETWDYGGHFSIVAFTPSYTEDLGKYTTKDRAEAVMLTINDNIRKREAAMSMPIEGKTIWE